MKDAGDASVSGRPHARVGDVGQQESGVWASPAGRGDVEDVGVV